MKHYVSCWKPVGPPEGSGMAVAGPFNSKEDAENWISALTPEQHKEYPCCQLAVGPDDLGPDWAENLRKWKGLK